ncbi:filamentous hemagglutinin N-terminal domain-containing protein [Sphingomonas sp.]|uniref:two-partner secretion domain-containing protein n=1 Tax=Sphingomonas sp. TaxID=28214 RepID=UPI002DF037CC|nr:filamentous hemagglutinin N-terminal domain-containing protein [Sphingomonas sp.]
MSPRLLRLSAALLAGSAPVVPLSAQATSVVADTGTLGLGTNAVKSGNIVQITGGTTAGANLFHSFSRFDLAAADTARWAATPAQASAIRNVVNRVTGGLPSNISGTLDASSFANADFYFLNPAGTIFRAGAQLNIPNAVYFSSASELRFASGGVFTVTTPSGASLSIDAPEKFGFVGTRSDINLANVTSNFARTPAALHLSGRNINTSAASVETLRLDLVATGTGDIAADLADPLSTAAAGNITLTNTTLFSPSSASAASRVRIAAGGVNLPNGDIRVAGSATAPAGTLTGKMASLSMSSGAQIGTEARGVSGGAVDLTVSGAISMGGASVIYSRAVGAGDAGAVSIKAGLMTMTGSSFVDGRNQIGSTGAAADISIDVAGLLTIRGSSRITGTTVNNARGGDVFVRADQISGLESARIESSTASSGSGVAGDLSVQANEIRLRGGSQIASQVLGAGRGGSLDIQAGTIDIADTNSGLFANCFGALCAGDAGDIKITSTSLIAANNSRIATNTFTTGKAGDITIKSNFIRVTSDASIKAEGSTTADGLIASGLAGTVRVKAGEVVLDNGQLLSSAFGSGDAGSVILTADSVSVGGSRGGISSSTFGRGVGGDVLINAGSLTVERGAFVGAQSVAGVTGSGDAGRVSIELADALAMRTNGRIGTSAFGGSGRAGSVSITAPRMSMESGSQVQAVVNNAGAGGSIDVNVGSLAADRSLITSSAEAGSSAPAGDVKVVATELSLTNGAALRSTTGGSGQAGRVRVDAGSLSLAGGSQISSHAEKTASGTAGLVDVTGGTAMLDGAGTLITSSTQGSGDAGGVAVKLTGLTVQNGAAITTDAEAGSGGNAGQVSVEVPIVAVASGGRISSSTFASGLAGRVTIVGDQITADGGSIASAAQAGSSGSAGNVELRGDRVVVSNGGAISSQTLGSGDAGSVTITAPEVQLLSAGLVTSRAGAGSTGAAGGVTIVATDLQLHGGAQATSSTAGPGKAGNVSLQGATITLTGGARASAEAAAGSSGAAGQVVVLARDTLRLTDAAQLSSATAGSGAAGGVTVNGGNVIVDSAASINSLAAPGSTGSAGGVLVNVTGKVTVAGAGTITSDTFGPGKAGDVTVKAAALEARSQGRISSNSDACANASCLATGDAGNVVVTVGSATMTGGLIGSSTAGSGNAGAITLTADSLLLEQGSLVSTSTAGSGIGGQIKVGGSSIRVLGASRISSRAEAGSSGTAGRVELAGGIVEIRGTDSLVTSSTRGAGAAGGALVTGSDLVVADGAGITADAEAGSSGAAGRVDVNVAKLSLGSAGQISSSTFAAGAAGQVKVAANTIENVGGSIASAAEAGSSGDAGNVEVSTPTLLLAEGGSVSSQTRGSGSAGLVRLTATNAIIRSNSTVTSRADIGSSGAAGNVEIVSDQLQVRDGSAVTSSTMGLGSAGSVAIHAADVLLDSFGVVSAEAEAGSTGAAGQVLIDASRSLTVSKLGQVTSATFGAGPAGGVIVRGGSVLVETGGSINSLAGPGSTGAAGDVLVQVSGAVDLRSLGAIGSDTFGPGAAGDVTVRSASLTVQEGGQVSSNSAVCPDGSCVGSGDAGSVTVETSGPVRVLIQGLIATSTETEGNGGNVSIKAARVEAATGGAIRSEASASGDAGSVRIEAAELSLASAGEVSTSTFGTGAAGQVVVRVADLKNSGGNLASSAGTAGGRSGNIDIASTTTVIDGGGKVQTSSASQAPAGSILLATRTLDVIGAGSEIASENSFVERSGAAVSAAAEPTGSAGSITIVGAELIRLLDGGSINTNSVSGPAGDIDIQMPADGLILLSGAERSGVITTSSGPGTGGRISIAAPFAIISDGGDILALGQQGGANVQITSDFFIRSADRVNRLSVAGSLVVDSTVQDVSSGTTVRELNIMDASRVLRGQCASVRRSRDTSQLAVQALGPYSLAAPDLQRGTIGGAPGACH